MYLSLSPSTPHAQYRKRFRASYNTFIVTEDSLHPHTVAQCSSSGVEGRDHAHSTRSGCKGKSVRPFSTLDLETTIAKKVSETLQDRIKRIVIPKSVQEKEGGKRQPLRPLATLNDAYLKDHKSFLFRSNSRRKLGDLAVLVRLANTSFQRCTECESNLKPGPSAQKGCLETTLRIGPGDI